MSIDQKVVGSNTARSKEVFFFSKNRKALRLGKHTKIRAPGATIARNNRAQLSGVIIPV